MPKKYLAAVVVSISATTLFSVKLDVKNTTQRIMEAVFRGDFKTTRIMARLCVEEGEGELFRQAIASIELDFDDPEIVTKFARTLMLACQSCEIYDFYALTDPRLQQKIRDLQKIDQEFFDVTMRDSDRRYASTLLNHFCACASGHDCTGFNILQDLHISFKNIV